MYAKLRLSGTVLKLSVLHMARMAKYPNFKFEVLNTSRVMITQGKLQYVHLSQFPGHKSSLPYNA